MPRLLHYSDVENVYDDPERAGRLAGRVRELDGEDALVVGTGDDTAPGVLPLVARGAQATDLFAAVGTDVETFGNHDFDFGPSRTRELVADSPQTWVSANVRNGDAAGGTDTADPSDPFAAAEGVVPWTVETAGGDRVGLFGLTDPATDSINPEATPLTFTDPYEAAADAVAALREQGADYVVCCSHLGAGDDELARRVDVDVVLGGHVHSERVEYVDGTLLTRPGVNGHVVIEVDLDPEGAVGDVDQAADGGAPDAGPTATRHEVAGAPVHEPLADALDARMAESGLTEVVARVDEPIERDEGTVFGGECRVGNLVADAYRREADADVGLQNSGGLRTGPPLAGEVTRTDLVSVLPFEEHVVVAELTGAELASAFHELAGTGLDFGEDEWWHGHLSGASVVWDDREAELREARVGGEPIDPAATYRVATSEYLLHTDHEVPTVAEYHRAGEYGIQHEVLIEHVRETGAEVGIGGRVRRIAGESGAKDGGNVTGRRDGREQASGMGGEGE
jgi:2',3'-cyclic-nucleotide 2'-phosphodiesterase (5'-nucleotidase family)